MTSGHKSTRSRQMPTHSAAELAGHYLQQMFAKGEIRVSYELGDDLNDHDLAGLLHDVQWLGIFGKISVGRGRDHRWEPIPPTLIARIRRCVEECLEQRPVNKKTNQLRALHQRRDNGDRWVYVKRLLLEQWRPMPAYREAAKRYGQDTGTHVSWQTMCKGYKATERYYRARGLTVQPQDPPSPKEKLNHLWKKGRRRPKRLGLSRA